MKDLMKESLVATTMVLIITFCISFIPFKFEFAKPIRQGFLGFDIYDLYYSGKHLENSKRDSNIILVQVADKRNAIADQIRIIEKYTPAVIGIDAVFKEQRDSLENIKLLHEISQYGNIILASELDMNSSLDQPAFTHNFFEDNDHHYHFGYTNIQGNQFAVARNYLPFLKAGDSIYPAFTSVIAERFAPEKFNELKRRNRKWEIINYTGNLENYTSLSKEELLYSDGSNQLRDILTGKIVLVGYFDKQVPLIMEDFHFSPLNEQVAGKSFPDMYGIVIHANILSMILSGEYASETSEFVSYLLAGIITFLFLYSILLQHKKRKHPVHIWLLFQQFLIILLILYLFLQVFDCFHVKVPLLPIMIALALCVELLDIYKMIAVRLHKKYMYKTIFK
ncbi:MAG: CHASE2 domain-containing protein [Bacteroidia bacterium]